MKKRTAQNGKGSKKRTGEDTRKIRDNWVGPERGALAKKEVIENEKTK